jgi:hypothetical protein
MWQTLERKARFISQVMAGSTDARSIEDLDSEQTLSFAEIKALATGSPLILRAAELDSDLARLTRLHTAHLDNERYLTTTISQARQLAADYRKELAHLQSLAARRTDTRGDLFHMHVGTSHLTDRDSAGTRILRQLATMPEGSQQPLGTLANITIYASRQDPYRWVWPDGCRNDSIYIKWTTAGPDKNGRYLVTSLERKIRNFDRRITDLNTGVTREEANLEKALAIHGTPSPHLEPLRQLRHERQRITRELEALGTDTPKNPPPEPTGPTDPPHPDPHGPPASGPDSQSLAGSDTAAPDPFGL